MVGRLRRAGCRRHPRRTPAVNDDQRHRRAGQLPPDPEWPGALGGRAPSPGVEPGLDPRPWSVEDLKDIEVVDVRQRQRNNPSASDSARSELI